MMLAVLLAVAFGIASFVFFVKLAIHAFRTSTGWGLAVVFLPFATVVYAIRYWSEVRKPFLAWLGTSIVTNLVVFGMLGLAAARIAEAQADALAAAQAAGTTDDAARIDLVPRGARTISANEPAVPAPAPSLDPDDVLARLPTALRSGSDDPALAGYPAPGPVQVATAGRYVGSRMRVTDRDGLRLTGRLVDADTHTIVLEKSLPQGSIEIEMPTREVRALEFLGP